MSIFILCNMFNQVFRRFQLQEGCWLAALALGAAMVSPIDVWAQDKPFKPLQQTVKVMSTNLDGFGIPFKVSDVSGQFIEVQLYISRDKGKSWSFHSRQPTSAREFPFTADGDGEYWFAIKTLDRDRRLLPDGNVQPELKIVVDSIQPKLEFQIESDRAGRVICRWQASDEGLKASSLKIEYRASMGELSPSQPIEDSWAKVPVNLEQQVSGDTWTDQVGWWPDTTARQLEVRMQVADAAGNTTTVNRYVAVQSAAWRSRTSGSTLGEARSNSFGQPSPNPVIERDNPDTSNWQTRLRPIVGQPEQLRPETPSQSPPENADRWRINETASTPVPGRNSARTASLTLPPGVEIVSPPVPTGYLKEASPPIYGAASGNATVWESEVQREESADRSYSGSTKSPSPMLAPELQDLPRRSTDSIPANPATTVRSGKNIISESTTSWPQNQWTPPPKSNISPESELAPRVGNLVPIKRPQRDAFTGRKEFSNAGFSKPQKAGTAEPVIATPTTSRPSQDAMPLSSNTQIISTKRFQLNYDINAIDPSGVGRVDLWMTRDRGRNWKIWGQDPDNVSPFPVEVSEEGIYGFKIVVRSKDGLAGRGPMRGDEADMWVQVDVTAPLVKIQSVPYGRGSEAGQLVINYAVSDSNLTLRPNHIHWSTNPDGPWTTIEENFRNDGRLLWKPGQNIPRRIFLRLEAEDRAGNVGVHNLEQAIDLSGLIPRGTIFGVVPVGE